MDRRCSLTGDRFEIGRYVTASIPCGIAFPDLNALAGDRAFENLSNVGSIFEKCPLHFPCRIGPPASFLLAVSVISETDDFGDCWNYAVIYDGRFIYLPHSRKAISTVLKQSPFHAPVYKAFEPSPAARWHQSGLQVGAR